MKENPKKNKYGDDRRKWSPEFQSYMEAIVHHKNYEGMPDSIDEEGHIRWNAPSNRPPGKWQDLRDRRLLWWGEKASENSILIKGKWISQVAKIIHPFKEKPCQTCGRTMSLDYVYPTKSTIQKINRCLPSNAQLNYTDFLSIYEVIIVINKELDGQAYECLLNIFPELSRCESKDEKDLIKFFSEKIIPYSPRGKLSPGAMANPPDRLDGFHTYNLCCRHNQDTGRTVENLKTYGDDRRAFEFWCEGDWAAANSLMSMSGIGQCAECGKIDQISADHVGPISLGFAHLPWFRPLCSSCNSSKGNRLSLSDVRSLITKESSGLRVASFQIESLWNKCKTEVDSNKKAVDLSKLLRINQHYYLFLLKEILDLGHPEVLLNLLTPGLAEDKIMFIGLNQSDLTFQEIQRVKRASTYSKSKAARMIRIAFDSLVDYAKKEKRNIHDFPKEFEYPLRMKVIEAVKTEIDKESIEDKQLGSQLNEALTSPLGPEERAALIEDIFTDHYRTKSDFPDLQKKMRTYVNSLGLFLSRKLL